MSGSPLRSGRLPLVPAVLVGACLLAAQALARDRSPIAENCDGAGTTIVKQVPDGSSVFCE